MFIVPSKNISSAWAEALIHIFDSSGRDVSPMVISINDFENGEVLENQDIRASLENFLLETGNQSIETVANTIFPASLWRIANGDRKKLFDRYIQVFPRYKRLEPIKNQRGLYFERLISYGRGPYDGNQLEYIISSFNAGSRVVKMKLQASIFDPERDLITGARLMFPCLQHISLVPNGEELSLNAYYATQILVEKAYGNYLGLCRLGSFMAEEMGLKLTKFNCFIGVEKLGDNTKAKLTGLVSSIRDISRN